VYVIYIKARSCFVSWSIRPTLHCTTVCIYAAVVVYVNPLFNLIRTCVTYSGILPFTSSSSCLEWWTCRRSLRWLDGVCGSLSSECWCWLASCARIGLNMWVVLPNWPYFIVACLCVFSKLLKYFFIFLVIIHTQYCCLQLCQDHSVPVFSSAGWLRSVYGVCYCGLAVRHQLLHLLDSRSECKIDTMLVFVDTNVSYPYMTHTQSASLIYCNLIVMLLCMC